MSESLPVVLLVEDDPEMIILCNEILKGVAEVIVAQTSQEAKKCFEQHLCAVVILDGWLRSQETSLPLVAWIRSRSNVPIVSTSNHREMRYEIFQAAAQTGRAYNWEKFEAYFKLEQLLVKKAA